MCGIAGTVDFDGRSVDRSTIQRMIDTIAHRGPDGEGVWTEGPVGLDHRRLAVLDPSPAGARPMRPRPRQPPLMSPSGLTEPDPNRPN